MSRELRDRLERLQVEQAAFPAELQRMQAELEAVAAELQRLAAERAAIESDIAELQLALPKHPHVLLSHPSMPLLNGRTVLFGVVAVGLGVLLLSWVFG